jgi:hypothetical protein
MSETKTQTPAEIAAVWQARAARRNVNLYEPFSIPYDELERFNQLKAKKNIDPDTSFPIPRREIE